MKNKIKADDLVRRIMLNMREKCKKVKIRCKKDTKIKNKDKIHSRIKIQRNITFAVRIMN